MKHRMHGAVRSELDRTGGQSIFLPDVDARGLIEDVHHFPAHCGADQLMAGLQALRGRKGLHQNFQGPFQLRHVFHGRRSVTRGEVLEFDLFGGGQHNIQSFFRFSLVGAAFYCALSPKETKANLIL